MIRNMRRLSILTALLPTAALAQCLVVGISDGDTFTARCGRRGGEYRQVKVRIAGIDAPEKTQPSGRRSRQALSDLCLKQQVRLTPRDWDRNGRMVASVSCQGQDAARHQVRAGMARVDEATTRGFERLYIDQSQARAERRGLWADKAPTQP